MTWTMSTGVDISHWQTISDYAKARAAVDWVQIKLTEGDYYVDTAAGSHYRGFAGRPRGGYHFARPNIDIRRQVAHYLARKAEVGLWERPDMLDAEVAGTTGAWIKELIAEYRRQSGQRRVLVYSPVDPAGWWDQDVVIWRARYRKIGAPNGPDDWARHLGWDHPGLGIYQWDDAWRLPGCPTGVDINSQRVALDDTQEDNMATTADEVADAVIAKLGAYTFETGIDRAPRTVFQAVDQLHTNQGEIWDAVAEVKAEVAALAARPAADVDEVALVDELERRGHLAPGASKAEVRDALREVFAAAASQPGATA